MHQTLGDYIRQRRLLLAAEALRTTQRPIFDIAMDLGYVSQQTFSRVFRREFDRTPATTAIRSPRDAAAEACLWAWEHSLTTA